MSSHAVSRLGPWRRRSGIRSGSDSFRLPRASAPSTSAVLSERDSGTAGCGGARLERSGGRRAPSNMRRRSSRAAASPAARTAACAASRAPSAATSSRYAARFAASFSRSAIGGGGTGGARPAGFEWRRTPGKSRWVSICGGIIVLSKLIRPYPRRASPPPPPAALEPAISPFCSDWPPSCVRT